MKSILISCVNYNTYSKLNEYIDSIDKAYVFAEYQIKITVLIGDNSNEFKDIDFSNNEIEIIQINNKGNLGYLGGISKAIELSKIDISKFDYFAISNVDIKLHETFFSELIKLPIDPKIGWLAPAIISEKENRDRNPKILIRPSAKKMQLTKLMYKFPIFYKLYNQFVYKYKTKKTQENTPSNIIYAGHGSFMLFTKEFTIKNKGFKFPSFLFGEEIFFGELIKRSGLVTLYKPELKIADFDHVNTSEINYSGYCKLNFESIRILTEKYF